jgi:hypothetical protein
MKFLLPALAVAIAAFCVWLIARIVNRPERWAKWTAVGLLVVLIGYPLSGGPARSLLMWKGSLPPRTIVLPDGTSTRIGGTVMNYGKWMPIYAPLNWAASQKFGAPIQWYFDLFPIPEKS